MTTALIEAAGEFGDPIAVRELISAEHGGTVLVEIGAPRKVTRKLPNSDLTVDEWLCPWRITGLSDSPRVAVSAGLDSMQALQSAMILAAADLEGFKHPVTWHGGSPDLTLALVE
ncbi:DUF6968 family protein [Nocardia yamanashiensis]|uniref:DUF6968 family protein n=1 Tax=Nocardia yamanashiensis TaxID=209247 RepID=UPI0008299651|nr:hypothetical protein [Nocardia yamanashiensis]